MARLVVASGEVVGPGKLEPCPGQPGPKRKNIFVAFRCPLRHAKTHLDLAEQKEPFNLFLLVGGPGLLQKGPRVFQPAGSDEEPAGLHVGKLCRRKRTLRNVLRTHTGRDRQCDRKRGARCEGGAGQSAYCFVPPNQPCTTVFNVVFVPASTPPTSAAPGPKN